MASQKASKSMVEPKTGADYKKAIVGKLKSLSGSRSTYDVFYDWIECTAISIQNSCMIFCNKEQQKTKDDREDSFQRIISQYDDGIDIFADMTGMLVMAMESNLSDILGEIYMESEMGNKSTGQFFTPFSISRAMAKLTLENVDTDKPISLNEPSCGSGGMIIAAASELQARGINFQRQMKVIAQDLDWKAVYMCYVQLSLYGIRATVVQGDTLSDPYIPGNYPPDRVWRTPGEMGLLI